MNMTAAESSNLNSVICRISTAGSLELDVQHQAELV
jgi:hypothetical protein